ncbi:hypothetical protein AAF712_011781 [Marasmius tenuissimus]|uniref:SHSP domain-containing protein n=1 Tax=Marasmius tenuissimus TaxID=585030 RepID=A0ABR2ZK42_9AGAR
MSYSYGNGHGGSGGEYHTHSHGTAQQPRTQTHAQIPSPTTPIPMDVLTPQWESLEQQQVQIQQRVEVPPIQPIQHSFFSPDDSRFHSPTSTTPTETHFPGPHMPHRLSFDETSYNLSGRGSMSPREAGTGCSSSSVTPTPGTGSSTITRGSRNTSALRRAHARNSTNPYPPSHMHAMQPPPPPPGREHRVEGSGSGAGSSSRGVFGHGHGNQGFRSHQNQHQHQQQTAIQQQNPQSSSQSQKDNQHRSPTGNAHSPSASTVLGSPVITSFAETSASVRTSPFTPPAGSMFPPPPPATPYASSSGQGQGHVQGQTPPSTSPQARISPSLHQYQPQTQTQPSTNNATARPSQRRTRLTPRADFHYDPTNRVLNVSMEIPGVKKAQVKITLATCLYNRLRQVTVKGRMDPVFPAAAPGSGVRIAVEGASGEGSPGQGEPVGEKDADGGGGEDVGGTSVTLDDGQEDVDITIGVGAGATNSAPGPSQFHRSERKYGDFARVLTVPSETRKEDVQAEMEDGILTLKISCGRPAESTDTQVIPIR